MPRWLKDRKKRSEVIFWNMQYSGQKIFFWLFFNADFKNFQKNISYTNFGVITVLNIFINTKSRNVRFSQDTLFLMLFKKKWLNLKKKKLFWHFFWKIDFWSIFVKLKIFWHQGIPKFLFHHFPISQVLNYSFMQKKLL